jgi:hypothetical protein
MVSPAKADRALRRLVADLAALHRDDAGAILEALSGPERRAVEALLEGFGAPSALPVEPKAFDRSALSPWLVQLIDALPADRMTSAAHETLIACAVDVFPLRSGKDRARAVTP